MKKHLKSIIAAVLMCVSASGVIACGAKDSDSQTNEETPNNSVVDIKDNDNKNPSGDFPQMPNEDPAYLGVRILDDSENELHRTSWEQVKDNHELVNDYSVIILEANKKYKFQGIYVLYDGWADANFSVYIGPGLDLADGGYIYENCEFELKYDETEVSISKEGCSYYEFYFTGVKEGEYNIRFDIVRSYTKNGNYLGGRTETFNLHFIFE